MSPTRNKIHKIISQHGYTLLLVFIGALLYLPTINYPFIWDDQTLIEENPHLDNISNITSVFTYGYLDSITDENRMIPYYRPLSTALLLLEKQLFGNRPTGYRLLHSSIHLIAILLFFLLLRQSLLKHSPTCGASVSAFWATLLLLTIPYSFDAVLFLTNVGDTIVLISMQLAILFHCKSIQKKKGGYAVGVFASTLVAAFSKETAIVIPIVLFLVGLLHVREPKNRHGNLSLLLCILAVCIFWISRHFAIQTNLEPNIKDALKSFPTHVFLALRWTLYPHPIALMEQINPIASPHNWWLLICGIGITIFIFRKQHTVLFGLAIWLVLISPPLLGLHLLQVFAPRYLYVPFVGIGIALGYAHIQFAPLVRKVLFALPVILMFFALIRIDAWKDRYSLWSLEYQRHPENALTAIHFSKELSRRDRKKESIALLFKAANDAKRGKHKVIESLAYRELAHHMLTHRHNTNEAKLFLLRSIRVHPTSITWLRLGDIFAVHENNYEKALLAYQQAELLTPERYETLMAISDALAGLQQFHQAHLYLKKANQLYGHSPKRQKQISQQKNRIIEYQNQCSSSRPN